MGYRGKLVEKEKARVLRARAWTLQEIADELGVAKASVSVWVRDVEFTPKPRRTARRRKPNALQRRKQDQIDAGYAWGQERVSGLSDRDLLIAGTALYAGDGAKRDGEVLFTNTDPALVALFCRWLRLLFDIDESKLRVRVYLHEGLDEVAAVRFWSSVTGIPASQFNAPYRAAPNRSIRHSKHQHGCATVRYGSAAVHRRIMGLVHAMREV